MIKLFMIIGFAFLTLNSCDNKNGFFGDQNGPNGSDSKDTLSTIKNKLKENKNLKKEPIDLPELLYNTSVTVANFHGIHEKCIGSGAFISPTLVVTNFHVVRGGDNWELTRFSDKKKFKAKIKKVDEIHDVCILEIENESVDEFLTINDSFPKIGSDILVAGSPIGLEGTITKGNISNIQHEEPYNYELLQISAPISPGNSGGPVINQNGEMIGIIVSSIFDVAVQNINFAVPAKYIQFLMHE